MNRGEELAFLIKELQKEMPEYASYAVPADEEQAFSLFRALCNVRVPGEHRPSDRFLKAEADLLRSVMEDKGVTDVSEIPVSAADPRLAVWQGDMTTLRADAIVNACNSQLLGCFRPLHSCIDNMIHTMAGVELREACFEIMRRQGHEEPAGRAKITPGYNLPARYVLHTVGPIVRGTVTRHDRELLASCYTSCLNLAASRNLENVAFCCISTGVFSFPKDKAAEIAVHTVTEWLDSHTDSSIREVVFNVFKDKDREIYDSLLQA